MLAKMKPINVLPASPRNILSFLKLYGRNPRHAAISIIAHNPKEYCPVL